ncbi:Nucleolar protein 6 [Aphelenchoides besseyi]|nr:Nucleolar protein 6 [Aphelenchoides besseyi]
MTRKGRLTGNTDRVANVTPELLEKSLEIPFNWISLTPKCLPPSFLVTAYNQLAQQMRTMTLATLPITGINCVSSYYRDTEPNRLIAVRSLWRRSTNGFYYQHLNEDKPAPLFVPTVKVFITLERNGKWGRKPEIISHYKMACYIELAEHLSEKKELNAIPKEDCVLLLMDGVVFKIVIIHDEELQLQFSSAVEFQPHPQNREFTQNAHDAIVCRQLQGVAHRFNAFSETCQLVKRWLAASKLSGHFDDMALELLVGRCFLEPTDRSLFSGDNPETVISSFIQFLHLLATHNFLNEPCFVDVNENLKAEDRDEIRSKFLKSRPVLPCLCISTPEDRAGVRYTRQGPESLVLCRTVKIAADSLAAIKSKALKNEQINFQALSVNDKSAYNLVIRLRRDRCTRYNQQEPENQKGKLQPEKSAIPAIDVDVTKWLFTLLQKELGEFALFFYDQFKPEKIFVVYRKNLLCPNDATRSRALHKLKVQDVGVKLTDAFVQRIEYLGEGIVESIVEIKK